VTDQAALNPYVGPRPFTQAPIDQGRFFGREQEAQRIISLIVSHRLILVYAQSGAGKTSLFNARIIPALETEFEYEVLPVARVRGVEVKDLHPQNYYIFNALRSGDGDPGELAGLTLPACLAGLPHRQDAEGEPAYRALIIDQLEEIFEYYPDGWQAQRKDFFEQVCEAIQKDPYLHVVFIIREDYLAKLKPFEELLPERLETRFRLELLGVGQALEAVRNPVKLLVRSYGVGAAEELVKKLTLVITQDEAGNRTTVRGDHVEPVQLQVVCQTLWEDQETKGSQEISRAEIDNFKVDDALSRFYDNSIAAARSRFRVNERALRKLFGEELITRLGTRSTVVKERAATGGIRNDIVEFLDKDKHLIRTISTRGADWVELTHDSLVQPILDANRRWQARRQNRLFLLASVAALLIFLVALIYQAGVAAGQVALAGLEQAATGTAQATAVFEIANQTAVAANSTQNADVFSTATAEIAAAEAANATATVVFEVAATAEVFVQQTAQVVANATAAEIAIQQTAQAVAEEQARLATSRQLAAQATTLLDQQRDLSLLLGAQSNLTSDTVESRQSLLAALLHERRLPGEVEDLVSLAFSPDGRLLATGTDGAVNKDGTRLIILWDVNTGTKLATLEGHRASVTGLAFSPDGRTLVSVSLDGFIIIWDVETRTERTRIIRDSEEPLTWDVTFHPDGSRFATAHQSGRGVIIWNAETGELEKEIYRGGFPVFAVDWSPDGESLAAVGDEGVVHVWNVESGREILTLRGHTGPIKTVVWSPDGKLLASAGDDGFDDDIDDGIIFLWDVASGRALPVSKGMTHVEPIQSLAFSTDGQTLASGSEDHTIRFWNVETGEPSMNPLAVHEHWVMGVAFSPDGQTFASVSLDGTVYLNNITARLSLARFLNEGGETYSVDFSPDGRYLAVATFDPTVHFWRVATGERVSVSLSSEGAAHDPDSSIRSLDFDKLGNLVTGSDDGDIISWKLAGTGNEISMQGFREGNQGGSVLSVAWAPDGHLIASGSTRLDNSLYLWMSGTGLPGMEPKGISEVSDVAFSPDGSLLASAGGLLDIKTGGIYFSNPASLAGVGGLYGHTDFVESIAFSPDGARLASGSSDDTVRIWDLAEGKILYVLAGHAGAVSSVAYSPDGRLLVSASLEGHDIRIWDANTGALLNVLTFHTDWVRTIAFSADGKTLASGSDDGTIILWNFDVAAWVNLACQIAGRNLTLQEWNQYLPGLPYQRTCAAFPPDLAAIATPTPTPTPTP